MDIDATEPPLGQDGITAAVENIDTEVVPTEVSTEAGDVVMAVPPMAVQLTTKVDPPVNAVGGEEADVDAMEPPPIRDDIAVAVEESHI